MLIEISFIMSSPGLNFLIEGDRVVYDFEYKISPSTCLGVYLHLYFSDVCEWYKDPGAGIRHIGTSRHIAG